MTMIQDRDDQDDGIWNDAQMSVAMSYDAGTGFYHVEAQSIGKTQTLAKHICERLITFLAAGKVAFIRAEPEADSFTDFRADKQIHQGWVRFSFKDEAGEWKYREKDAGISVGYLGEV